MEKALEDKGDTEKTTITRKREENQRKTVCEYTEGRYLALCIRKDIGKEKAAGETENGK